MAFCTLQPGIPPCTVLWSHAFLAHVIASLYLVLDHAQQCVAATVMERTSLGPVIQLLSRCSPLEWFVCLLTRSVSQSAPCSSNRMQPPTLSYIASVNWFHSRLFHESAPAPAFFDQRWTVSHSSTPVILFACISSFGMNRPKRSSMSH